MTAPSFQVREVILTHFATPGFKPNDLKRGEPYVNLADRTLGIGLGDGRVIIVGGNDLVGLLQAGSAVLLNGSTGGSTQVTDIDQGYYIRGTTSSDALPNDLLLLTNTSDTDFTKQVDNRGFMVGIGCQQLGGPGGYAGTLSMLASQRFVELYPAAISAHASGNFAAGQFTLYQNGQAGFGQAAALQAYGMLNHRGNHAIGIFGRVDCYTGGLIDHELNTFNFFGDAPSPLAGFPNRGDQTNGAIYPNPPANPVTLTLACGGAYRSTAATYVGREGSPSNGAGANYRVAHYVDGRYVTDVGIMLDSDGQPGGSTYNNGHGAPDTLILGRMAPTSFNGLAIQAVGLQSAWTSIRNQISLSTETLSDDGVSPSPARGNNLTVSTDGSISGRKFQITPTGDMTVRSLSLTAPTVVGHTASANRQIAVNTSEGTFYIPLNS